ncbi:hypothetical protein ACOZ38_32000 [Sphaerisporangium viridialbum]|uniref:GAP1-N2 domain-containing protein n=1 Tax=Sphaerisporangium viridialbum TaxID=46189 RepID=UPI003C7606BD
MAWQLHYTSAEAGPSGRAGFQFVAESPGLPPGLAGKVAAYLAYKPPPDAPLAPTPAQVAELPVALAYGTLGELSVLTRCVYLGQDYSGRYGNFLGHAVVAGPGELTGLRPVEFWQASLWSDVPAPPGTALPELADPLPGDRVDPESLAAWLARGGEAAYTRLGVLLEIVGTALSRGHGRLVLVSADVEEIVRWIAVISYSLPWPVAARLPFLTYSADPGTAPYVIVGTTPDVWMPSDIDAAVVRLDDPPDAHPPLGRFPSPGRLASLGRFARTVTDCWRRSDLAGIDAISELGALEEQLGRAAPALDTATSPGSPGRETYAPAATTASARGAYGPGVEGAGAAGFDPETGAALLAFCRGDASVTAEEQAAIARALSGDLPEWLWRDLGRMSGQMGYELASAVRDLAPSDTAERCAARCAVLALRDHTLPPPRPARRQETRDALRREAARALATARDLDELGRAAGIAHAVGAPVAAADLGSAARSLVRDGRGDLGPLLERVPVDLREAVLAGAVHGMEEATDGVRHRMLSDAVCARLESRDLSHAPRTGTAVVLSLVRRERISRIDATVMLIRLGSGVHDDLSAVRDAALLSVWEAPPGTAECSALVGRLGNAMSVSPHLSDLPIRAFLATGFEDPEVVRLAELVRDTVPGYPATDAEVVLLATGVGEAARPRDAAALLQRLEGLGQDADEELLREAVAAAARALTLRDPRFRAEVVKESPQAGRAGLTRAWLDGRRGRDEQMALLEVAVRLHLAAATVPDLDAWARSQLSSWSLFGSVESHFKHDGELAAGLREMAKARRGPPWKREAR